MIDSTSTHCVTGTQIGFAKGAPRLADHRHLLVVLSGPDKGLQKQVRRSTVRIGTAENSDLRLSDPTVSRQHTDISVRGMDYLIRDLGSTNGTRVNSVEIDRAYLTPGAIISVGESEIRFDSQTGWLRAPRSDKDEFGELYGQSDAMRSVFGVLERVAPTELTCLLVGETGTGKDLAARSIHAHSARSNAPFEVLDCGALSESVADAELFGYQRGAFTGAEKAQAGVFERANGGTVFIDEIGELPLSIQPKLLRVLEQREIKRLGDSTPIELDLRVLAATHRDLEAQVAEGSFREDLYYRIAEIQVALPPLRLRLEDLPGITKRLAPGATFEAAALDALRVRDWPGNVRELRNLLKRVTSLADNPVVTRGDVLSPGQPTLSAMEKTASVPVLLREELSLKLAREQWLSVLEERYLQRVCELYEDDLDAVAAHVEIHRKSVQRLLKRHGEGTLADD